MIIIVYCLSHIDLIINPYSQSVTVGKDATFLCYGDGSYLYWFINGVNTENMTTEEMTERGIQFSGYYNHYPPYVDGCDIQHSELTMAGNCINNNTVTVLYWEMSHHLMEAIPLVYSNTHSNR